MSAKDYGSLLGRATLPTPQTWRWVRGRINTDSCAPSVKRSVGFFMPWLGTRKGTRVSVVCIYPRMSADKGGRVSKIQDSGSHPRMES